MLSAAFALPLDKKSVHMMLICRRYVAVPITFRIIFFALGACTRDNKRRIRTVKIKETAM